MLDAFCAIDWAWLASAVALALSSGVYPLGLMLGSQDCICCTCNGEDPREFGDPTPFSTGTWYYWSGSPYSFGNWYDLCNWYTEKPGPVESVGTGFTRRAESLPPPGATIHVYSHVSIDDDGKATSETVHKAYFWDAGLAGTLYCSTAEFNTVSRYPFALPTVTFGAFNAGTIYGTVRFESKATTSPSLWNFPWTYSRNEGTINGDVEFIGSANNGTVNGAARFYNGEVVPLPGKEEPDVVNGRLSSNGGKISSGYFYGGSFHSGEANYAEFYDDSRAASQDGILPGFDPVGGIVANAIFRDRSQNWSNFITVGVYYDSAREKHLRGYTADATFVGPSACTEQVRVRDNFPPYSIAFGPFPVHPDDFVYASGAYSCNGQYTRVQFIRENLFKPGEFAGGCGCG